MLKRFNFFHTHLNKIVFIVLVVLVLLDRLHILLEFAFNYVDDDQAVIWYGAKEFAEFRFHEPCFFGQNYNPMLESLFAAPLFSAGIAPYIATPIVTSVLVLFPYIILSYLLLKRKREIAAFLILAIPILLPIEFGLLTSIPRGFVTGIFVASFAIISILYQSNKSYFFFSFFSFLAVWVNPNATVVLFPVGCYLLLNNYRNVKFYLYFFLGSIIPLCIHYLTLQFYILNPNYVVHGMQSLQFHFETITLNSMNKYLKDMSPLFWGQGLMYFFMLFSFTVVLLIQKNYKAMIVGCIGISFIVFCLGINKVRDGIDGIFFSHSRMFIGAPLLLACLLLFIEFNKFKTTMTFGILIFSTFFFVYKKASLPENIKKNVDPNRENYITVAHLKDVKSLCNKLKTIAEKYKASLVIVNWKHFVNNCCPCLDKNFPPTIEPVTDKRTWRLKEEGNRVIENLLFVGAEDRNFGEKFIKNMNIIRIENESHIFIYKNNKLKTVVLLDSLGLPMRPH